MRIPAPVEILTIFDRHGELAHLRPHEQVS